MAGLKDADDFKDGERLEGTALLQGILLKAGLAGVVLFFLIALAWGSQRGAMSYSWLFAVTFFLTLSIGGLFWTLLHHATNSGWGTVVRRQMETIGSGIPLLLLLAIPMILPWFGFRDALWEWFPKREASLAKAEEKADKEWEAYLAKREKEIAKTEASVKKIESEMSAGQLSPGHRQHYEDRIEALRVQAETLAGKGVSEKAVWKELRDKYFLKEEALLFTKRGYLNHGFYYFRFFLYVVALSGIIFLLRTWSVKQDGDGDTKWFRWMRRGSCGFLPLFAASWTFLVFDWLMALDYKWFSTMWGVYLFAGCALSSMAFLIIVITTLRHFGYLKNVVTMEHYHLMGKLLHAFTIFWAYIAFSQFFLIWYANITEETIFYIQRNTAFWNGYTIAFLVIGHFFVPFVILLVRQVKKMPLVVSGVCAWIILMHLFDIYWIVIPERALSLTAESGELRMWIPHAVIFDLLAFVSVGCLFGWFLLRNMSAVSLFPCRDPRLDESLNVVN